MSSSRCSKNAFVKRRLSRSGSRCSERLTTTNTALFKSRARQLIEQFVGTLDDTSVFLGVIRPVDVTESSREGSPSS